MFLLCNFPATSCPAPESFFRRPRWLSRNRYNCTLDKTVCCSYTHTRTHAENDFSKITFEQKLEHDERVTSRVHIILCREQDLVFFFFFLYTFQIFYRNKHYSQHHASSRIIYKHNNIVYEQIISVLLPAHYCGLQRKHTKTLFAVHNVLLYSAQQVAGSTSLFLRASVIKISKITNICARKPTVYN